MSPDLLTAFWTSTRAGGAGAQDLYTASREGVSSAFSGITNIMALNSNSLDANPTVTGDGLTLVFESDRAGQDDLYVAIRPSSSGDFGAPAAAKEINSPSTDANPFAREDGQVLYFATDRDGNGDIYRASWSGTAFGSAVPVTEINSAHSEGYPVVTPDELTIYWASSRPDGGAKGDLDIWRATRPSAKLAFSDIENVGELNTPVGDVPSFVTSDDCTLFLSRDAIYLATRGM